MKLKSITIATGIFPPDIGGPASFIPLFSEALVKRGIKVEVISLSDHIEYPADKQLSYKICRISRKIKKPWRDYFVVKKIYLSAINSQLIFSNTLAFESSIASIISRKPLFQKVVGDIAWERANISNRFKGTIDEYQDANHSLLSILNNYYRNFSVNRSNFIITPSHYLKKIVEGWGYPKEKIFVVYNAVELNSESVNIPKKKFRITTVARLVPHKGIDGILSSLSHLNFDYEFIVIGDGPEKDKLMSMALDLGIDTKFLGNIAKDIVASYLKSSDIFILNSSYEGLPHVVLEAMANCCTVIVSKVGGNPEIVKDGYNGLLFKYNNQNEITKKINKLESDRKLREKLVKNGFAYSKKLPNFNSTVDNYIKIFENHL